VPRARAKSSACSLSTHWKPTYAANTASAEIAGARVLENRQKTRPAARMPLNQRSMMKVVPMAARQPEKGARIIVP
jgi:hypothetical protein